MSKRTRDDYISDTIEQADGIQKRFKVPISQKKRKNPFPSILSRKKMKREKIPVQPKPRPPPNPSTQLRNPTRPLQYEDGFSLKNLRKTRDMHLHDAIVLHGGGFDPDDVYNYINDNSMQCQEVSAEGIEECSLVDYEDMGNELQKYGFLKDPSGSSKQNQQVLHDKLFIRNSEDKIRKPRIVPIAGPSEEGGYFEGDSSYQKNRTKPHIVPIAGPSEEGGYFEGEFSPSYMDILEFNNLNNFYRQCQTDAYKTYFLDMGNNELLYNNMIVYYFKQRLKCASALANDKDRHEQTDIINDKQKEWEGAFIQEFSPRSNELALTGDRELDMQKRELDMHMQNNQTIGHKFLGLTTTAMNTASKVLEIRHGMKLFFDDTEGISAQYEAVTGGYKIKSVTNNLMTKVATKLARNRPTFLSEEKTVQILSFLVSSLSMGHKKFGTVHTGELIKHTNNALGVVYEHGAPWVNSFLDAIGADVLLDTSTHENFAHRVLDSIPLENTLTPFFRSLGDNFEEFNILIHNWLEKVDFNNPIFMIIIIFVSLVLFGHRPNKSHTFILYKMSFVCGWAIVLSLLGNNAKTGVFSALLTYVVTLLAFIGQLAFARYYLGHEGVALYSFTSMFSTFNDATKTTSEIMWQGEQPHNSISKFGSSAWRLGNAMYISFDTKNVTGGLTPSTINKFYANDYSADKLEQLINVGKRTRKATEYTYNKMTGLTSDEVVEYDDEEEEDDE